MSHEIRTPMNAIMGFTELIASNYNNKAKLKKFSEIIDHRCNDLLDIINDILDIAKIESGQLSVNYEECDLAQLFSELTAFFKVQQKRMDKEHIQLELMPNCEQAGLAIITDKVKLKQILINLINNAFKYTQDGKISGGCRIEGTERIVFFVSDTGMGIPKDKHSEIFERFMQLNNGTELPSSGTGLGLSIVRGLVKLLGGNIYIESEIGKGSTFTFEIPLKTIKISSSNVTENLEIVDYDFSSKSILIVEDDFYNAEYLKEILADTGITIFHATDGLESVKISLEQSIDIVLMDIRLPGIDGYEAIKQMRRDQPNLIIIAQTAYAAYDEKRRALDAGCNDYISKPTKRTILLSMVNSYLKPEINTN